MKKNKLRNHTKKWNLEERRARARALGEALKNVGVVPKAFDVMHVIIAAEKYLGIVPPAKGQAFHKSRFRLENCCKGFGIKVPIAEVPIAPPNTRSAESLAAAFYESYDWRRVRYDVLIERGRKCDCCGRTPKHGIIIHVDHIKPLKRNWELRLDKNNLQVLCNECNHGKGNRDETDWRSV